MRILDMILKILFENEKINDLEKEKIIRLKKWFNKSCAPPLNIFFDPTNCCNLKCVFCWQRNGNVKNTTELSENKILQIVDESARMGVSYWRIAGGGEPLFRKRTTLKIMSRIKKHGMFGELITNGTLFDSNSIKNIVEIGWDKISFSLDGPDAKTNDNLRAVNGAFSKCVNTIKLFEKYKKNLKKDTPSTQIATVVVNKNYKKIDKIILLAYKLGIKSVVFEPVFGNSKEIKKLKLKDTSKLNKHVKLAAVASKKYNISTNVENLIEPNKKIHSNKFENRLCFEPWLTLVIRADGRFGPCCMFEDEIEKIENISLKEAWYGKKFSDFRKNILNGNYPKYCSNCTIWLRKENDEIKNSLYSQGGT